MGGESEGTERGEVGEGEGTKRRGQFQFANFKLVELSESEKKGSELWPGKIEYVHTLRNNSIFDSKIPGNRCLEVFKTIVQSDLTRSRPTIAY